MTLASHVVDLQEYVDSFEQSVRSLLSVADDLDPEDWRRPTDLPGWSVHDVVSHLAAVERELLVGEPPPALATYGAHVRDAFGQHMERGVAVRRGRPSDDVVAELRSCLEQRLPQMRAMRADEPPTRVVAGEDWDATELLRNRAFDSWMHEQDVRRAVTRPGNLDGPGALVTKEMLLGALPVLVARRADAVAGQSLRLESTGALAFSGDVVIGADGRGGLSRVPIEDPTAIVRADWETWVRLLGGRMSPSDAVVEMDGDRGLAQRLVDGLCFTP
jgi:uncharacterized protein (TIGR03083 family)